MPNNIAHFAIHADDVDRARRFYEATFGWQFSAWGPPGFFLIRTGSDDEPGIAGALQRRREPLSGVGMRGFECTISVASIPETIAKVKANGGVITLEPYVIEGVGTLIFFDDTEGNRVGAMQYDSPAS